MVNVPRICRSENDPSLVFKESKPLAGDIMFEATGNKIHNYTCLFFSCNRKCTWLLALAQVTIWNADAPAIVSVVGRIMGAGPPKYPHPNSWN